jgi:hypothetical protein
MTLVIKRFLLRESVNETNRVDGLDTSVASAFVGTRFGASTVVTSVFAGLSGHD